MEILKICWEKYFEYIELVANDVKSIPKFFNLHWKKIFLMFADFSHIDATWILIN